MISSALIKTDESSQGQSNSGPPGTLINCLMYVIPLQKFVWPQKLSISMVKKPDNEFLGMRFLKTLIQPPPP